MRGTSKGSASGKKRRRKYTGREKRFVKGRGQDKFEGHFFGKSYHCGEWGALSELLPAEGPTDGCPSKGKGLGKQGQGHSPDDLEEQVHEDRGLAGLERDKRNIDWILGTVETKPQAAPRNVTVLHEGEDPPAPRPQRSLSVRARGRDETQHDHISLKGLPSE